MCRVVALLLAAISNDICFPDSSFGEESTCNAGDLSSWEGSLEKGKAMHSKILAWSIQILYSPWVAKTWTWRSNFHFLSFSNDKLCGTFSHILFYYPSVFFNVSVQIFCTFLEFEFRPFNELKEVGKMKYNKSRKEVIVIDPLQRQKGLPSKICLEC